jgi:hypothetical protein
VFSDEIASFICRRIADGQSLRAICSKSAMPSRSTVTRWLAENEDFWGQYARAREQQAHTLIDEAIDLARSADDNNNATLRLKIDTLKWAAAKLSLRASRRIRAEYAAKAAGRDWFRAEAHADGDEDQFA